MSSKDVTKRIDYTRRVVVNALLTCEDNIIEDKSGRATLKLHNLVSKIANISMKSFPNLLRDMEHDCQVLRNTNAKRTYAIELGEYPKEWIDESLQRAMLNGNVSEKLEFKATLVLPPDNKPREEVASGSGEPPVASSEPLSVPDPMAPPADASEVAYAILEAIAEILARPATDEDVKVRLAAALEENQRLRLLKREYEDEIYALKQEQTHLRQELNKTRNNLDAAMKQSGRIVNEEVKKQIHRFLQERPKEGVRNN